jgi:ABC-type transporter Mla subunit MlaD
MSSIEELVGSVHEVGDTVEQDIMGKISAAREDIEDAISTLVALVGDSNDLVAGLRAADSDLEDVAGKLQEVARELADVSPGSVLHL